MRRAKAMFARLCIPLAAAALFCLPARADEPAAVSALRQDGHVALMRHADAPGGAGDPAGFKLDDCATQRNLSGEGRRDAKAMGDKLRAAGVSFAKVSSSPWCRCVDTARLMEVGPVEIAATFGNAYTAGDNRDALTQGARQLIAGWQGPGALLVVTHGANIQSLIGYNPLQGEIVVVPAGETRLREVGRIAPPRR